MDRLRCPACDAECPASAKFCMDCGEPVGVCPTCGTRNPLAARFCMECGSALAGVCPSCRHRNPLVARFCIECGTALAEPPAAASPFEEPAAAVAPALRPPPPTPRILRAVPPPPPTPAPSPPRPAPAPLLPTPSATPPPTPVEAPAAPAPESYTPRHLAEKILTSRAALEGERKQVTVLFADLKGSTELIQSVDAEDAQILLDGAVKVMMEAIHTYEGTVTQIMGDGLMALFGAPLAHEDHAARACYAALAMQEGMRRYGEDTQARYGIAVQIRVGLNSGEVVVRAIANDLRMDYSAMGQTVHLAARMEQNAQPGTTLLTAETLRLAEGYVQARSLGPIPIKGLTEPLEVFELIGTGPIRTQLQAAAARGLTRFVGREAEFAILAERIGRAAVGKGQVLALVGEAGNGKSRLVWEAIHSPWTRNWLVLESSSVAFGRAAPYAAIIDLLKNYFRIATDDDRQAIRDKLEGKLLVLDPALEPLLSPLLALLDVPVEDPEWRALDPPERRRRTQDAVRRLLLREAEAQPLLVVLENLHWVDSETRALLDILVDGLAEAPAVLLVSYRPEYQDTWGDRPHHTCIPITALTADSAEQLLGALVGDDHALRPLRQLLIEQTQGNPFFLEECVRGLVETGALVGERGSYRLTQALPNIRVPATVQAVLAARIDRLPPEAKRLLQSASVVGKDVPYPLLREIAELPGPELDEGLAHLEAAEFLYETRRFPELEYTFKHALTQDVAYEGLLQQRRRALHTRLVEVIEGLYAERLTEHVDRLAQHAFAGEVWEKAVAYFRQAAAKAVSRAAYRAAVSSLERALTALDRLPGAPETRREAVDIHLELRSSLQPLGEHPSIHRHLLEAERLAEELGDKRRLARISSYLCSFSLVRDPDRTVSFGQRAVELAAEVGELGLQVTAAFFLGEALYSVGDFPQATDVLRNILAPLEGDRRLERFGMTNLPAVSARCVLARSLAELGEFAEAGTASDEAIRIAEEVAQPYSLASAYSSDGFLYLMKGDLPRAIRSLERSLELCRTWSFSILTPAAAGGLGYAHVLSGDIAEGLPLLERAAEQAESMGPVLEQASVVAWLGEAMLLDHRAEQALDLAKRGLELAAAHRQRAKQAHALRILGAIHAERGPAHVAQAEDCFRQGLSLAEELGLRPLQAHCRLGLSGVYRRTGSSTEARAELSAARELYRSMEATFWLARAEVEWAEVAGMASLKA